jgi:hypothetical protein
MASAIAIIAGGLVESAWAETPRLQKAPPAAELVDAERLRQEIDAHVRELGRQMRATLSEDLRRELARSVVVASNEVTPRG